MASIKAEPPRDPAWLLTIDEDERWHLLAACDFALQFLHRTRDRQPSGKEWFHSMSYYVTHISHIEQLLSSAHRDGPSNV